MSVTDTPPWSMKMVSPLEPAIVCSDLGRMLHFYEGVLGLRVVFDAEATPEMSAIFGAAPHGYRIVRLQTPYGDRVKLIQAHGVAVETPPAPEWVFERHGLAYLTFVVSDIDDVTTRLKERAVRLVRPAPVAVRKGFVAIFAEDPEGNFVEFVKYDELASYRPDLLGPRSDR